MAFSLSSSKLSRQLVQFLKKRFQKPSESTERLEFVLTGGAQISLGDQVQRSRQKPK